MRMIREALDRVEPYFTKNGKLKNFYPIYEAVDTFLYTPGTVTTGPTQIRDAIDLKRIMVMVAMALGPCIFMAMFNTGLQANEVLAAMGKTSVEGWRGFVMATLQIDINPNSFFSNLIHGALYFVPVFLVANITGGLCEVLFSCVRKHEINEGFLVTGLLYPLTLPPLIPLWQVAVGIIFGVVIGKEVFGGTGKNFLNPALTARAFLFFAYPMNLSGDGVWTAVDGYTGATALSVAANQGLTGLEQQFTWWQAFIGTVPGSMGETSTLACLMGAGLLIVTGIGSWRVMLGMFLGGGFLSGLLSLMTSASNPMFSIPFYWHFVIGSFAFGSIFMATDPVSAAQTNTGKWIYGFLVGVMSIVVRSLNPAYPEGVMLAVLFGNVFAPLIDYFVLKANISRRLHRVSMKVTRNV